MINLDRRMGRSAPDPRVSPLECPESSDRQRWVLAQHASASRKKNVKPVLDDELMEACRRAQQERLGYSDTRDELARKIVDLLRTHPDFTRTQVIARVGLMGTPI